MLAENTRGKYCSVPAHEKQRAREKVVLDCRENKRAFFGPVELGKAGLETARIASVLGSTGNQIQEHQSKLREQFPNYFLFSIERTKQSLKRLLQLRDVSCWQNPCSEHLQVAHSCKNMFKYRTKGRLSS